MISAYLPLFLPSGSDSHFFWGAVLLGYLLYDTAYSLAFFSLRSGAVMLAHHLVGIAGCVIGAVRWAWWRRGRVWFGGGRVCQAGSQGMLAF